MKPGKKFKVSAIITKRMLISDFSKTFDIIGWFSPTIIKVKILFQRLWELEINWHDPVPMEIQLPWSKWRSELPILSTKFIPRCYFPHDVTIKGMQLHGFSDASESAYSAVVYFRFEDTSGNIHTSLITSKMKVVPIKQLTIHRLELCGTCLLTDLLSHVKEVFHIPMCDTYAWSDSTIVIDWINGNLRRFKTYVGNRISHIIDHIPPDQWNHINGKDNPADCVSRELFPSELVGHDLWWTGHCWLQKDTSGWPELSVTPTVIPEELRDATLMIDECFSEPIISQNRYSDFYQLKGMTTWIHRFVKNCQHSKSDTQQINRSVKELDLAEKYWIKLVQETHFGREISLIKKNKTLPRGSCLITLHPFVDDEGILRLRGRIGCSNLPYKQLHLIILHGNHQITKMIVRAEHLRLLHAGPTMLASSICVRFHIIGGKKVIRDVTQACMTCRRHSARPQPQVMGQLPDGRVTPGMIIGIDYAGPIYVKYGYTHKPTIVKAYICVFVSLTVKAVHLELVLDLTSEAFIACLRRFMARRGKPSTI